MYIEKIKSINYTFFFKLQRKKKHGNFNFFYNQSEICFKNIQHNEFFKVDGAYMNKKSVLSNFIKTYFISVFHFITYCTNRRRTITYFSKACVWQVNGTVIKQNSSFTFPNDFEQDSTKM